MFAKLQAVRIRIPFYVGASFRLKNHTWCEIRSLNLGQVSVAIRFLFNPITGFKLGQFNPITGFKVDQVYPITGFKLGQFNPITGFKLGQIYPITGFKLGQFYPLLG